jgi:UDP-N-acetylmuramoyl-L-alanyl-D-glutamate--2,6-diaminopimelate ligase
VVTSDNPRSEKPEAIISEILSGMKESKAIWVEKDRAMAIKKALSLRENNEIVMILGKGDETYQEINGEKFAFDDREIVRSLLSQIG